ncbi:MAG: DHH family phosphoesterase [Candidatus Absconditabacteria bacterium]
MNNKLQIKAVIENAHKIAIFGHRNPDGDCVGSLLGMGALLQKQGKDISYFTPTAVSNRYSFVGDISRIKTEFDYGTYDLLLFLDFSDISRIYEFWNGHEEYFTKYPIVVIDHHISKTPDPTRLRESDPNAMSACEVIFELVYPWWPDVFDKEIATCFYLGLTTDSGNMTYDEDHERILKNSLKLIQLGANKKLIINNVIRNKSFKTVKMMERMFARLEKKGDFVYSRYTGDDIKELGVSEDDADAGQIVIQDIAEAKATCIFREQDGSFHGSLRSKSFDVEQIARSFGGGGHLFAAGFRMDRVGDFKIQLEQVSNQIASLVK